MRFLPCLAIGAAVALAVTAEGCDDRACLEWQMAAEGPCPSQADAREFFGECSDVERVDSGPTFLADEGGLCCYDVTHVPLGQAIPCRSSTTTRTHSTGSSGGTTTTNSGTGGSDTTPPTTATTSSAGGSGGGGGGGGAPSCETCDDALTAGNDGDLCSGPSSNAFTELLSCGCGALCSASCHDFCAVGAAPTGACSACLESSCASELSSCEAH